MLTMVEEIYGDDINKLTTEELSKHASTNKEVLKINNFIIDHLSGQAFT